MTAAGVFSAIKRASLLEEDGRRVQGGAETRTCGTSTIKGP